MSREVAESTNVTLVELLDRVIDRGVILAGDITISVADVDLIYLGLRVMLASVERRESMEGMEGLRAEREESRDA